MPTDAEGIQLVKLDDIERLVRETLAVTDGFAASKRLDREYLSLTITASLAAGTDGAPRDRVRARIWTSGVEAFFLELDERFNLKQFDWEPEGQEEIVRLMTKLAMAYLQGHGGESESKGTFGRRRKYFEIDLDGQAYRFASNS